LETLTFQSRPEDKSDRKRLVHARVDRLAGLASGVAELVARVKPCAVVIEGYSFASVGNTSTLAEYGGLLRASICPFAPALYEVSPASLKKFASTEAGKGKTPVVSFLTARIGEYSTDDEYDAVAAAWFGVGLVLGAHEHAGAAWIDEGWCQHMYKPGNVTQRQAEALSVVANPKPKKRRKAIK